MFLDLNTIIVILVCAFFLSIIVVNYLERRHTVKIGPKEKPYISFTLTNDNQLLFIICEYSPNGESNAISLVFDKELLEELVHNLALGRDFEIECLVNNYLPKRYLEVKRKGNLFELWARWKDPNRLDALAVASEENMETMIKHLKGYIPQMTNVDVNGEEA